MSNTTKKTLNNAFIIGIIRPDNLKKKWTPIFPFRKGKVLGLTSKREWVVQLNEGDDGLEMAFGSENVGVSVLSLLESDPWEFKNVVFRRLSDLGIGEEDVEELLPLYKIVETGLKLSDYWADLALKWVPFLRAEDQNKILDDIQSLSTADWASQKVRHSAKKMYQSIRKADS